MNDSEFKSFIATMASIWPDHKLPEDQVLRWKDNTRLMRYEQGVEVVSTLERSSKFWPSFAEFHQTWRSLFLQPVISEAEQYAGPTPEGRAVAAQIGRMLIEARPKQPHWHGGPDPCPICTLSASTRQPSYDDGR
jgi:hypothetical protein